MKKRLIAITVVFLCFQFGQSAISEIALDAKAFASVRNKLLMVCKDNHDMMRAVAADMDFAELNDLNHMLQDVITHLDAMSLMLELHTITSDKITSEAMIRNWARQTKDIVAMNRENLNSTSVRVNNSGIADSVIKSKNYMSEIMGLLFIE